MTDQTESDAFISRAAAAVRAAAPDADDATIAALAGRIASMDAFAFSARWSASSAADEDLAAAARKVVAEAPAQPAPDDLAARCRAVWGDQWDRLSPAAKLSEARKIEAGDVPTAEEHDLAVLRAKDPAKLTPIQKLRLANAAPPTARPQAPNSVPPSADFAALSPVEKLRRIHAAEASTRKRAELARLEATLPKLAPALQLKSLDLIRRLRRELGEDAGR